MDFSNLTAEQLLEELKQRYPNYDILNLMNTYSTPAMLNSLRKGYDVGLMQDAYNKLPEYSPIYEQILPEEMLDFNYVNNGEFNPYYSSILGQSGNISGGGAIESPFPSDYGKYDSYRNDLINSQTGEVVASPGYFNPNSDMQPAELSAAAMIANNRQIGDSSYTIDDLRANGFSNEQLLAFLRNLSNKGIKF